MFWCHLFAQAFLQDKWNSSKPRVTSNRLAAVDKGTNDIGPILPRIYVMDRYGKPTQCVMVYIETIALSTEFHQLDDNVKL